MMFYISKNVVYPKKNSISNWKTKISHEPALQNYEVSIKIFQKRIIRWIRLWFKQNMIFWIELLKECIILGVTTSIAAYWFIGSKSFYYFLVHITLWIALDYIRLTLAQVKALLKKILLLV